MDLDWSPRRTDWPAGALQQDWAWGEVLRSAGALVERCRIGPAAAPVGHAQVLRRRFGPLPVALVSRGPVWAEAAGDGPLRDGLRALRRALGGAVIVTGERGGPGGVPLVTPAHVAEIPLAAGGGAGTKMRSDARRAARAGLVVTAERRADWLAAVEAAQATARGYRGWPPALSLAHPAGRLFVARRGRTRVAAMLFLRHGDRATYQIGWSGPEGRAAGAHALCLVTALEAFRGEGVRLVDLGTVDTRTAPGLARFKIAAGGRVRALGATCWLPPWL